MYNQHEREHQEEVIDYGAREVAYRLLAQVEVASYSGPREALYMNTGLLAQELISLNTLLSCCASSQEKYKPALIDGFRIGQLVTIARMEMANIALATKPDALPTLQRLFLEAVKKQIEVFLLDHPEVGEPTLLFFFNEAWERVKIATGSTSMFVYSQWYTDYKNQERVLEQLRDWGYLF